VAAQISLTRLDPVDLEQTQFGPDAKRWLTDVVDIVNSAFNTLTNALSSLVMVGQTNAGSVSKFATVVAAGVLPTYFITGSVISSTNANISIVSITAGTGDFLVEFNAIPGASAMIAYQVFAAQPQ
jgi:hypothetical protein